MNDELPPTTYLVEQLHMAVDVFAETIDLARGIGGAYATTRITLVPKDGKGLPFVLVVGVEPAFEEG